MAPKHHPTPLSGGDRKALTKELGKARAMTGILAAQSAEMRAKGAALIQQADRLLCESWNERMWSDGEPIDPSPTIDQAINGGFPWLEIQCSRCKTPNDVDLAALKHPPTTFVHDLASRLPLQLLCESWNERMWSDGEPIDPSPTIDQAINGGFPWLEIQCSRCKTPNDVDLAALKHPPTTFVHDLASRLRCRKCAKAGRRPSATLLQLGWQPRHPRGEV